MRASHRDRLAGLVLGLRPSAAHIYGTTPELPIDNLTMQGMASWSTGIDLLRRDLSRHEESGPTEQWITAWLEKEAAREAVRWQDASTMLELLALAVGPSSPSPGRVRPDRFWESWTRNLRSYQAGLRSQNTWASPDTRDLARHCCELINEHHAPTELGFLLADVEDQLFDVPLRPHSDAFRPLSTTVERLQLSAVIAASYDPTDADCTATTERLFERRPALRRSCARVPQRR